MCAPFPRASVLQKTVSPTKHPKTGKSNIRKALQIKQPTNRPANNQINASPGKFLL